MSFERLGLSSLSCKLAVDALCRRNGKKFTLDLRWAWDLGIGGVSVTGVFGWSANLSGNGGGSSDDSVSLVLSANSKL